MATVKLDSPGIGDEIAIVEGAPQVIPVQASLVGNANPQDWTLRASSLEHPNGRGIDDQQMVYDGVSGLFQIDVNAGQIPNGKPNAINLLIRVTALKNTGGAGGAEAQCMVWIESSSSSSSPDKPKPKGKSKSPALVSKAKAAMVKSQAKPAPKAAAKTAPAKKPSPAKKPAKKK